MVSSSRFKRSYSRRHESAALARVDASGMQSNMHSRSSFGNVRRECSPASGPAMLVSSLMVSKGSLHGKEREDRHSVW